MNIGELAQRTGLAPSRIRFYERIGLLMVERQANGYRTYHEDAILTLQLIISAQKAGFSLEELRVPLESGLTYWEQGTLIDTLLRKVSDIEALQAQLAESKAHLIGLIAQIKAKPNGMDCATNAKRVFTEIQQGKELHESTEPKSVRTSLQPIQPNQKRHHE